HRRIVILLSLLTTFAGVALIIDQPKGTLLKWFSVPLLVGGGTALTWALLPQRAQGIELSPSLASRLLDWVTRRGRLVPFFPIMAIAVVLADVGYNLTLSATPALQSEDIIVLLGA